VVDDDAACRFTVATNTSARQRHAHVYGGAHGATNTAVSVDFATANVTATAVNDYTATNGTLPSPRRTTNIFTLDIVDDQSLESVETFQVRLSGPATPHRRRTNIVTITMTTWRCGLHRSAWSVTEETTA